MNPTKRLLALLLMLCMVWSMASTAEEGSALPELEDELVIDTEDEHDASDAEEVYIPDDDEELASAVEILDAEIDDSVDLTKLNLNQNLPEDVVNILLIGVDGRDNNLDVGVQHGDVQIIVSINKQDGSMKLTSVLRDLYVTIPGYKAMNRINVAYARGGGQLAMRTMNELLELNIQHYVSINFYGLASIIDSLGGIDIELTKAEATAINNYISKNLKKGGYDNQGKDYKRQPLAKKDGVQHLDGIQAVMYARLRSIDNDFKRSERQRHLLELLLSKVLDEGLDLDKLLGLLETCLPYAETNMSAMDMINLAMDVLESDILSRMKEDGPLLEQNRIPMDETWKYYTTEGGASVVAFRTNKRQQ
ncbi:MAG: LCP family protein [Clostridiales bacterium]|nr:LCP family protein [Clostridiales bacterium]